MLIGEDKTVYKIRVAAFTLRHAHHPLTPGKWSLSHN